MEKQLKDFKEQMINVLIELMNNEGDAHSESLKDEHLRNAQALSRVIKLVESNSLAIDKTTCRT